MSRAASSPGSHHPSEVSERERSCGANQFPTGREKMPFVQITWLPKACRTAAVRKEVAEAVIKVRKSKHICQLCLENQSSKHA